MGERAAIIPEVAEIPETRPRCMEDCPRAVVDGRPWEAAREVTLPDERRADDATPVATDAEGVENASTPYCGLSTREKPLLTAAASSSSKFMEVEGDPRPDEPRL